MYVRIEKPNGEPPYRSLVYGMLGKSIFSQYIVLDPDSDCFELIDNFWGHDSSERSRVLTIQSDRSGFTELTGSALLRLKFFAKERGIDCSDIDYLSGYPDVCTDHAFLCDLLTGRRVPRSQCTIQLRDLPDKDEWTYLDTQEELDRFMHLFAGFHDAALSSMQYIQDDEGTRTITAVFDNRCWYGVAALCFEGVSSFQFTPTPPQPYRITMGEYQWAEFRITPREGVYWADSEGENIIRAYSVKWKKVE
nr:hypothetical protein [Lachnospiraceae bacterium]